MKAQDYGGQCRKCGAARLFDVHLELHNVFTYLYIRYLKFRLDIIISVLPTTDTYKKKQESILLQHYGKGKISHYLILTTSSLHIEVSL